MTTKFGKYGVPEGLKLQAAAAWKRAGAHLTVTQEMTHAEFWIAQCGIDRDHAVNLADAATKVRMGTIAAGAAPDDEPDDDDEPSEKKCAKCGHSNEDDAEKCVKCGEPLPDDEPAEPHKPVRHRAAMTMDTPGPHSAVSAITDATDRALALAAFQCGPEAGALAVKRALARQNGGAR